MNWNNKQPSAFPFSTEIYTEFGMTLRDYFAAKAMQGLMSGRWKADMHGIPYDAYRADADEWAKSAYYFADAMLKAREA
jgi:hypothetical protein